MTRTLIACALFITAILPAFGQNQPQVQGEPVSGVAVNRSTVNASAVIAAGGTFQVVLPSIIGTTTQRQELTINNNNASDPCYIFIGAGTATEATALMLNAGSSYRREWPFVPSDEIQATCKTTSDTLYIDTQ
jgi:hypothetical protein